MEPLEEAAHYQHTGKGYEPTAVWIDPKRFCRKASKSGADEQGKQDKGIGMKRESDRLHEDLDEGKLESHEAAAKA